MSTRATSANGEYTMLHSIQYGIKTGVDKSIRNIDATMGKVHANVASTFHSFLEVCYE
jgi:hypothetical protein